ncbi:MAG TPA: hypothetical protein VGO25_12880, partial [Rhodanobacteraceae bacterium]|nr:hypothetical protein [Rhodanobacteraceae bacterium]
MRSFSILAACVAAAFLAAIAASSAHAAVVPLIVEQLDAARESPPAERIVAGAYDSDFTAQSYAALIPSREHAVWYRIRLSTDWTDSRPPTLAIFDPVGLHVDIYVPP